MAHYLETVLEQFADKANVIIQTDADLEYGHNVLGNHWAVRWRNALDKHFSAGIFRVKELTWVCNGGSWHWIITLDRPKDWITDKLSSESNCLIKGVDF